jgi:hypothetical protein
VHRLPQPCGETKICSVGGVCEYRAKASAIRLRLSLTGETVEIVPDSGQEDNDFDERPFDGSVVEWNLPHCLEVLLLQLFGLKLLQMFQVNWHRIWLL